MTLARQKRSPLTKENTTIVEGAGDHDKIQGRVKQIKAQIDETSSDYDKEKLQERLAKICRRSLPSSMLEQRQKQK